jgi:hypothetical protein
MKLSKLLCWLAVLASCAGCGLSTYPQPTDRLGSKASMARNWSARGSHLTLKSSGEIAVVDLQARFFCPGADDGRVKKLSGSGTWQYGTDSGASAAFLRLENGCTATFWLGTYKGERVLWTQIGDADFVRLG